MGLHAGEVHSRYRIEGPLGAGAMADVYLASHVELGVWRAIKVLKPQVAYLHDRLVREGRAQAALMHPNVVPVVELIRLDGRPALVMEYVDGVTLHDVIVGGDLGPEHIDALARGMLEGVHAAHERRVVHRDLKPANVMVDLAGRRPIARVTDFGLAKVVEATDAADMGGTGTGMSFGTPMYMSPEQFRDVRSADERSDVWALGAILYELVTGVPAFPGADPVEILRKVDRADFVPVDELAPHLPGRMVLAIEEALQPDLDHRCPTVEALLTLWIGDAHAKPRPVWDMQRLRALQQQTLPSPHSGHSLSSEGAHTWTDPAEPPSDPKRPPRKVARLLAQVAVFGVAFVAIAGWFAATRCTPQVRLADRGTPPGQPVELPDDAPVVTYLEPHLPSTLDPLVARDALDVRTQELVFDRIFYRHPLSAEWSSRLVERHEVSDDGLVFSLWMAPRTWHDGEPVRPEDVCFTLEAFDAAALPADRKPEGILDCEVEDGVVHVELAWAVPQPRSRLAFPLLPAHVFASTTASPADFGVRPVGTGPMRAELDRDAQTVRFVRHDADPDPANIQAMRLVTGLDPADQVRMVETGEAQGIPALLFEQWANVAASDNVALKTYDRRTWWFIAVNHRSGALSDPLVREAIDLSLDRTSLIRDHLGALPDQQRAPARLVSGPYLLDSPFRNGSVKPTPHDPYAATERMLQAGAALVDGTWTIDGERVHLRLGLQGSLHDQAPAMLSVVTAQLRAAGFAVTPSRIDERQWASEVIAGKARSDFDLVLGAWAYPGREDVASFFHSRVRGEGNRNIFAYANPTVDQQLATIRAATSADDVVEASRELHRLLAADRPYLFLWQHNGAMSAWHRSIRTNRVSPYTYFSEFRDWIYEPG